MKICNRCGRYCNDNDIFCECGNRFDMGTYDDNFDRISLKNDAKTFYGINSGKCIGIMAGSFGIIIVLSMIYMRLFYAMQYFDSSVQSLITIPLLLVYAALFVSTVMIMYAFAAWFKNAIYAPKSAGDFFKELFNNLGAKFSSYFLSLIKIFLWSLLFYIPGIMKYYEYSMASYIVSDNPNIGAGRSLKVSAIMTNGYKWDLLVLDFSFFGWFILSAFTMNILGIVYVFPYFMATKAFTYEYLKTKAINSGKINPAVLNVYTNGF